MEGKINTIKRISALLAVLALIPLAWGEIATNESPLRLAVELADGSHLVGAPDIASIPVQTAYAKLDIELKHVRSITLEPDRELALFDMRNGDRVKGALLLKTLQLQTAFGKVAIGAEQIVAVVVMVEGKGIACGGMVTTNDGFVVHTFTNVGTANFTVSGGSLNCDMLVVAGGGGGGRRRGVSRRRRWRRRDG